METTLEKLALQVGGTCLGDSQTRITGANPIQDAQSGDLTLLDSPKHRAALEGSAATAVLVAQQMEGLPIPQILVTDVHQAFQIIAQQFRPRWEEPRPGIHRDSHVDPSAKFGREVWVGEGSSIGRDVTVGERSKIHRGVHIMDGCKVGADCELFPGSVLYPDTILGDRVLLHAGAIVGAYGFGYRMNAGRHERTAQIGRVRLGSDVEVGANTTIDRGTYGETSIGDGTKIDNQVQIGHNCKIGKHNLICAHVGIAGSSSTGDHVVIAGQVGVKDHVRVGNRVMVAAQSGISNDIADGSVVMGSPAQPIKREMQCIMVRNRLPDIREQVREMASQLATLQSQLSIEMDNPLKDNPTDEVESDDQKRGKLGTKEAQPEAKRKVA